MLPLHNKIVWLNECSQCEHTYITKNKLYEGNLHAWLAPGGPRHHGYPLHLMAGAKGLYTVHWSGEIGYLGLNDHRQGETVYHASSAQAISLFQEPAQASTVLGPREASDCFRRNLGD